MAYQAKMTHPARRERRRRILEALQSGRNPCDISEEENISERYVIEIGSNASIQSFSRSAGDVKRLNILTLVKSGVDPNEICKSQNISRDSLKRLCRQEYIKIYFNKYDIGPNAYKVLYLLLYTDKSMREVARELGITDGRVAQIAAKAKEAGIKLRRAKEQE